MIKNILFDLGGVLLNLDQNKTVTAFEHIGLTIQNNQELSDLMLDFENGKCSELHFISTLKLAANEGTTEQQIIDAWNAMLLEFPAFRVEILKELKHTYKLYLFSNTNAIHLSAVLNYTDTIFGKGVFEGLFDEVYYSHQIGMRKPEVEAFQKVMQLANIKGHETFFIDDSMTNITGAQKAGLHTILAKHPIEKNFKKILMQMATSVST
jgi:FMN phosphatase YigB (HAD superfamily)